MGWGSANDIVEPQIEIMKTAVENEEMPEQLAITLLSDLIEQCQAGDWDTEDETLEQYDHIPWVVKAFERHGIVTRVGDQDGLEKLVRQVIDAVVEKGGHDLSEDFWRRVMAKDIAEAVNPKVEEWV